MTRDASWQAWPHRDAGTRSSTSIIDRSPGGRIPCTMAMPFSLAAACPASRQRSANCAPGRALTTFAARHIWCSQTSCSRWREGTAMRPCATAAPNQGVTPSVDASATVSSSRLPGPLGRTSDRSPAIRARTSTRARARTSGCRLSVTPSEGPFTRVAALSDGNGRATGRRIAWLDQPFPAQLDDQRVDVPRDRGHRDPVPGSDLARDAWQVVSALEAAADRRADGIQLPGLPALQVDHQRAAVDLVDDHVGG